jgi:ABC-type Zn uptake system ZnuABC Zn-binding protein ZnuA
MPRGSDPHTFEPTPSDLKRIAGADLVIVNGAGLEAELEKYLQDVEQDQVVVASEGLKSRTARAGEPGHEHGHEGVVGEGASEHATEGEADPHFWLDPILVQTCVDNIAIALSRVDVDGGAAYRANAAAYKQKLAGLDGWMKEQVATVPAERRKLIMNHASHGYWADRYGFRVLGAVIPSVSTNAAPTAEDLADLLSTIESGGVPAIFVEVGENPQLAAQIAADAGVAVVDDLYTGSLSEADGPAATYVEMMRYNTNRIVEALR